MIESNSFFRTGFCIILLYNLTPFKIPPSPSADSPAAYLAKSDLDKLIIDGDKDMLKIFNSMGISTTHIKELKTMLKGAPMIKEEGIYGFEPSFIKGNSKHQQYGLQIDFAIIWLHLSEILFY
jgi:hypothetical protein